MAALAIFVFWAFVCFCVWLLVGPRKRSGKSMAWRLMNMSFVAVLSCSGARSRLIDANATLPARTGCAPDTQRCHDRVPEICMRDEENSAITRWWPMHGMDTSGYPAKCAVRCIVDEGWAQCAGMEETLVQ